MDIFCRDLFTSKCAEVELKPGLAAYLTTGWNLSDPEYMKLAKEWQHVGRFQLNSCSPQCRSTSTLWTSANGPRDPDKRVEIETEGVQYIRTCVEMYKAQLDDENYFTAMCYPHAGECDIDSPPPPLPPIDRSFPDTLEWSPCTGN